MWLRSLLFIVPIVAIGSAIGWLTAPGDWYAALVKPSFNPPNWVFGPVWTALYVLIGIVGWRVWDSSSDPALRRLWIMQMALNFAWSPAFFALQNILLALVLVLLLFATIVVFVIRARKTDPVSALMFLPYAAWVGFASLLNAAIWWLN